LILLFANKEQHQVDVDLGGDGVLFPLPPAMLVAQGAMDLCIGEGGAHPYRFDEKGKK
jgi:hypothetical protein